MKVYVFLQIQTYRLRILNAEEQLKKKKKKIHCNYIQGIQTIAKCDDVRSDDYQISHKIGLKGEKKNHHLEIHLPHFFTVSVFGVILNFTNFLNRLLKPGSLKLNRCSIFTSSTEKDVAFPTPNREISRANEKSCSLPVADTVGNENSD